jgi:hypothetical protein
MEARIRFVTLVMVMLALICSGQNAKAGVMSNPGASILRDGYFHYFDPGNVPLITIPPNGTGTFHVGWFFQNARGRWERDDEAAKVFLLKGKYKIRIMFRNVFPRAALYDVNISELKYLDVWTGKMESPEITIEVN